MQNVASLLTKKTVKYFLPFLFILIILHLNAQNPAQQITIKGLVADSVNHSPLGFATVVLVNTNTGKTVQSVLTKADGSFTLAGSSNHHYKIRLNYVGYITKEQDVPFGPAGKIVVDLGLLLLSPQRGQLKEVSVTAAKPFIKQEVDKLSYDVQADPESKANDAFEMLRKVPMISIDGADMIKLNGSDSYQIFINGKPSALMASNPADVLKQIPAATILRIEVITTPPAKYDAEGLAGIINIVTVKKKDEGFTGSLFSRYNTVWGVRGSVTVNAKTGNLGVNVFLGAGHQGMVNTQAGSQIISTTNLLQHGNNLSGGNFRNGNIGLSYEIDSLNLLTANMDFNHRNFDNNTYRNAQRFSAGDSLIQSYQLTNLGNSTWGIFDLALNYQMGFKHHKDQFLTFSYQYSSFDNKVINAVTIADPFNYDGGNYNQLNQSNFRENTFQVDFAGSITKAISIEAGAKAILRDNHSDFESNNETAPGVFVPDTIQNNRFDYRQYVYSVYNSWQLKSGGWIVKAGLRAEHTAVNSPYIAGSTPINQNYTNLLPSISVQLGIPHVGALNAGFTERMQRPWLSQLNPFIDRGNPDIIITGNPALKPILNHLIELSFSNYGKASLRIGLNYAFANNTIQNLTFLLSDTVSETTWLNIGKNKTAAINLSFNYPFTDKLNIRLNGQLAHLWMAGMYNNVLYQNSAYQVNTEASAGYKFGDGYYIGADWGYYSGNVYLQGSGRGYEFHSIVANRDFYHKRMNLSLTIYSPFQASNEQGNTVQTANFVQTVYQQNIDRSFRIGFNYKFGKISTNIKTNKRGIKNDDVQNGDNSGNQ